MSSEPKRAAALFQRSGSRFPPYVVLPFLIISLAVGALAYRSYRLSARMEKGVRTLAIQYLDYAAEITARRTDAAVRGEMFRATEEWQQLERGTADLRYETLAGWVAAHPWILSAIYIPDADPESSLFVRQALDPALEARLVANEIYSANGSVQYRYDPSHLVKLSYAQVERQPQFRENTSFEASELRQQSRVRLVARPERIGLFGQEKMVGVVVPLSQPMDEWAIEASIVNPYVGSGLQNYRLITLLFGSFAVGIVLFGALLAIRGLARESEAMQLRAALIANVSHELRTPLSMIRLGAETLKRGSRLGPKERADLEDSILREVQHLSLLVENVLDIARLQKTSKPLAVRPVNPEELVSSVVTNYESWVRSKGFELELHINDEIEEQMWDRESLSRALLNLMDNAMKYSGDEKFLAISLSATENEVEIGVADRGVGIPAHDLEKIFEPYYRSEFSDTTTARGAGLGLTLVQQIVQSHGGRVEVDSTPGEGSTFRLLLPRRAAYVEQNTVAIAHERSA
jgi:signal transduction histidine kinase